MTPESSTQTAPVTPFPDERDLPAKAPEGAALWQGASRRVLLCLLLLLALLVPASVAFITIQLHEQHEDDVAVAASRKLALALTSHLERTVESIESFLDGFSTLPDDPSPEEIYTRLLTARLPASVIQVTFVDPSGAVVASNLLPPGNGINLADREHIRVHMNDDPTDREIFISKPVKGRISGTWSIQFTRALRAPDGKLRGIIAASYQISDFIEFYEKLLPEGQGLIALVGFDGVVRASVPAASQLDGMDAAAILPGLETLGSHANGPYVGVAWDDVRRIGYSVHSDRYPFLVVVAADRGAILAESHDFHVAIWGIAGGLGLTLAALALFGLRHSRLERAYRERELKAHAQEREAQVLQAISRVPGIHVLHVENGRAVRIGDATDDILPRLIAARVETPEFLAQVAQGNAPSVAIEHFSGDGEAFEVELVLTRLRPTTEDGFGPADSAPPATVVFALDETAKRMEENKLYQMSKMAALGELVTGLAHEINQPLGVIRLAASNAMTGLRKGLPGEHTSEKLERIIRQVERMKSIIDHMRIFGRKDALTIDPSSAETAVEGTLQVLGTEIRLDGIELSFAGSAGSAGGARVPCRQEQLEQVLINLVLNARDAIRARRQDEPDFAGRIAIAIECCEMDAQSWVLVTVRDNGGGIPAAAIGKIFQPFFTTKPPGQGTGLGLSVSFGIIREYGGTLTVANVEDGAVFTIAMPQVETEAGEEAARAAVASPIKRSEPETSSGS
ncbi:ATP-binding protein [Ancylobacter rudongensis]|nr:ATP-binding protein [Ancylobacter rudongensis]